MKKRLLDFREKLSRKKKILLAIITTTVGLIIETVILVKFITTVKPFILAILFLLLAVVMAGIVLFFVEDIHRDILYEKLNNKESEAHERLKSRLTNEFQVFSLKTDEDYDYFSRILVQESPYVFKAKMENDIIYYQFETKDGEIFHKGELTSYLFFEKNIV